MPDNVENISVMQQVFSAEVVRDGVKYFRAPDHFAPSILSLPGFSSSDKPEGTELEDLPKEDPERDETISGQAVRIQHLEAEVSNLRTDNSAMSANLGATLHERDQLKLRVHELEVRISDLEEELQEAKDAIPEPRTAKKG